MPKLTHPDTKHVIDVAPDAVPMYASQGWRPVRAKATKKTTAPKSSGK